MAVAFNCKTSELERDGKLEISVEVHPFVGVANISIRYSDQCNAADKTEVEVKTNAIIIVLLQQNSEVYRAKFVTDSDKCFHPPSCSNLSGYICRFNRNLSDSSVSINDEHGRNLADGPTEINSKVHSFKLTRSTHSRYRVMEMAFRMQMKNNEFLGLGESSDYTTYASNSSHFSSLLSSSENAMARKLNLHKDGLNLQADTPCSILCACCGEKLSQDSHSFHKIVDLPSADWEDFASEWWCHKHDSSEETFPTYKPSEDTILINDMHLYVHTNILTNFIQDNLTLRCQRCLSNFGDAKCAMLVKRNGNFSDTVAILKHQVYINSTGKRADPSFLGKTSVHRSIEMLSHFIERNMLSTLTCKLCLETKNEISAGISLLIWVMDRNLHRHYSQLLINNSEPNDTVVQLKMNNVIKVLYGIAPCGSDQARRWRQDFCVDVQEVSEDMMWCIISELQKGTKTVSPSQREVDDLMISYLPATHKCDNDFS